jgi:hypothetical protein
LKYSTSFSFMIQLRYALVSGPGADKYCGLPRREAPREPAADRAGLAGDEDCLILKSRPAPGS